MSWFYLENVRNILILYKTIDLLKLDASITCSYFFLIINIYFCNILDLFQCINLSLLT